MKKKMNSLCEVYSDKWWESLSKDRLEPTSNFGKNAMVMSEFAARSMVLDAIFEVVEVMRIKKNKSKEIQKLLDY